MVKLWVLKGLEMWVEVSLELFHGMENLEKGVDLGLGF